MHIRVRYMKFPLCPAISLECCPLSRWVKESPEIQNYVDCLCVRQQPSLLCDAQHHQELEAIRPTVIKRLEHAKAGRGLFVEIN